MSDQFKHSPINIPIESGDDDLDADSADVIEIDGDDLVYDPNELEAVAAADEDVESDSDGDGAESPVPDILESLDPYVPSPAELDRVDDADVTVAGPEEADDDAVDASTAETVGEEMTTVSKQAVIELMQELRQKTEAINRLSDERSDLYDKLLRKQAEFENFRKRGEREMQEAYVRARADLLLDLLPVLDNFDLAVQHADSSNPDVVREGVHLIHKQLFDSLFRLGLEPVEADGQPFDPELHEAVATEPTEEVPDHTVLVVLQRGYKLGDRMLRPARVKVAVTP